MKKFIEKQKQCLNFSSGKGPSSISNTGSGRKRAIVIGCNYKGTSAELKGCINDVNGILNILIKVYRFSPKNITVLSDGDKRYQKPVGALIKKALIAAVQASQPGDVLFVHYSGHGTQVPTPKNPGNPTGKAQGIVPCDMNVILDDDLVEIFSNLKKGVHFTFIADCCHSGTLLNQPNVVLGQGKGSGLAQKLGNLGDVFMVRDLPGGVKIGSKNFKNRSLPFHELTSIFQGLYSKVLGYNVESKDGNQGGTSNSQHQADPTQFYKGLRDVFGNDASKTSTGVLAIASQGLGLAQQHGMISEGKAAQVNKIMDKALGGNENQQPQQQQTGTMDTQPKDGGIGGIKNMLKPGKESGGTQAQTPSKDNQLQGRGILISGCTAQETSADACPSGNPSQAYGALSHALITVIKQHAKQTREPISSREVVVSVREMLQQAGFNQHPCLEGEDKEVDKAFIIG